MITLELAHPNCVCVKYSFFSEGDKVKKKKNELQLQLQLQFLFFVKKKKKDEVFLNIVMDYMSDNLYQVIKHFRRQGKQFPNLLIKLYSYQMFRSLAYIHALGICHRDIKP